MRSSARSVPALLIVVGFIAVLGMRAGREAAALAVVAFGLGVAAFRVAATQRALRSATLDDAACASHKRGAESVAAFGGLMWGVASLDILGNVIPYIAHEEEKMEEETQKLLGTLNGSRIDPAPFAMSAQCNRVAVEDGHTESIAIRMQSKPSAEEIIAAWNNFRPEPQQLRLPSAPAQPVVYMPAADRPQPRFDCDRGGGMTTSVGRLRKCSVLDWKFTVLSHNTIRGAAGAAVLNAELLKAKGYLD